MIITFKTKKLEKQCNSLKEAQKKWGERRGRLVMRRLDEIRDSDNLQVLCCLPQARCHLLKGNLKGIWSVDLEHPYRLLFEPADAAIPVKGNGPPDIQRIEAVLILGVEDTHG